MRACHELVGPRLPVLTGQRGPAGRDRRKGEHEDKANHGHFDVIVSDIGLPDGTGYDLMREVASCHGLPGIAMSGYGMAEDLRRSREAGFLDHLIKRVRIPQLLVALGRVADRHAIQ